MPNVRCPYCRRRYFISENKIVLTERQLAILNVIPDLCLNSRNGHASSTAIAAAVGWSTRTIQLELSHLEHIGEVARPGGPYAGWVIPERLILVQEERLALTG